MNRRGFIAAATCGLAGGAVSAPFASAAPPPGAPVLNSYVTNVRSGMGSAPLPKPGDEVVIRREAGNSYDRHALLVSTRAGVALGNVPPIHSRMIEPFLAAGYQASGWVQTSRQEPRPRIGIAFTLVPAVPHQA